IRDMASTTAGVAFFRSLGGAVGVAGFGAILTARLNADLPAAGDRPAPGSPDQIQALPAPVHHVVLAAFTRGLWTVFLVGVPIALLGFLAFVLLKELPLRGSGTTTPVTTPAAAPAAAPAPPPPSRDDLVLAGLLLELIAQRVEH